MNIQKRSSAKASHFLLISNRLAMVYFDINQYVQRHNHEIMITSMIRKHTSDSGIHSYGRAIDFLVIDKNDQPILHGEIHKNLLTWVNNEYIYDPMRARLKTLMWHSAGGKFGGYHFHLQVRDKNRPVPLA